MYLHAISYTRQGKWKTNFIPTQSSDREGSLELKLPILVLNGALIRSLVINLHSWGKRSFKINEMKNKVWMPKTEGKKEVINVARPNSDTSREEGRHITCQT